MRIKQQLYPTLSRLGLTWVITFWRSHPLQVRADNTLLASFLMIYVEDETRNIMRLLWTAITKSETTQSISYESCLSSPQFIKVIVSVYVTKTTSFNYTPFLSSPCASKRVVAQNLSYENKLDLHEHGPVGCKWIYGRLYIWTGEKQINLVLIDHRSYRQTLSSCEIKAWKNSWTCRRNSFSYLEWFRTKTRFDTEEKGDSEMAYWVS